MTLSFVPRFRTANAVIPGNPVFWQAVLEESDRFAFETAQAEKGGPFGAQLWAFNKRTSEYVLIADPENMQDSNAVTSKGIASAHAEAENLSPENRERGKAFLQQHKTDDFDWDIVQISSGESCPSCRAKQVIFAQELKADGLIAQNGFHVLFKATYEQTAEIAGFNDKPFDLTFRAIAQLGMIGKQDWLFSVEKNLRSNPDTGILIERGQLVFNPVSLAPPQELEDGDLLLMKRFNRYPVARVLSKEGEVLGSETQQQPGQNAIIGALQNAALVQRSKGVFESWDLNGAVLQTNIRDIGPAAYAETLWYNLSGIEVIENLNTPEIDAQATEITGMSNAKAWELVAAEYNVSGAPINVAFATELSNQTAARSLSVDGASSVAHLFWNAAMAKEALLRRQVGRLKKLGESGIEKFYIFDGGKIFEAPLHQLVQANDRSSDYDGKRAEPSPSPLKK